MVVIYIDMDYFFAACEELRHPELAGKPFVVGTSPPEHRMRGVVQTCNYEARKYGIHSAMPMTEALKLCKDLGYVPPDDAYYEGISAKLSALVRSRGYATESDSIDEFAVDVGDMGYPEATKLAGSIKAEVRSSIGLPCTIGISSGKTFAKMVCDSAKPDGLRVVPEPELSGFLAGKSVDDIPGIGRKLSEKLASMGLDTVDKLARASATMLVGEFGEVGTYMHMIANGRETERVVENTGALSIGRERAVRINAGDAVALRNTITDLSGQVSGEVTRQGVLFKTVTIKVRYGDFTVRTKSISLNHYTDSAAVVLDTAVELSLGVDPTKAVNKLGVRVSSLVSMKGQKKLF